MENQNKIGRWNEETKNSMFKKKCLGNINVNANLKFKKKTFLTFASSIQQG